MIFSYKAKFGEVDLNLTSTSCSHGHALAQHRQPNRNGARLESMGRNPLEIQLSFIFFDSGNEFLDTDGNPSTNPERDASFQFAKFNEMLQTNTPRTLVHPYLGSLRGRISDFSHDASAQSSAITCQATFIEEIDEKKIVDPDSAISATGSQAAQSRTLSVDDILAENGLTSTVTGEAREVLVQWESDPTISARRVQLEMTTLNNKLSAELITIQSRSDLSQFPIVKAYTNLQHTITEAAMTYTAKQPKVIDLTVHGPAPLRLIAASFYGAREANERFLEIIDLNPNLRQVGMVPRGTLLKVYAL